MKILLDTATFLWICLLPGKLSARALALYDDPTNDLYLSAVSSYEIVAKANLAKLDLGTSASAFISAERKSRGIASLALDEASTLAVERLPAIHTDPFDRLLIGQSVAHGMTLLTADATIALYPIRTAW